MFILFYNHKPILTISLESTNYFFTLHMATEHINTDDEHTCYICFESDQSNNSLLRSPCKICNMYVHQSCLDKHLIRAAIKEKCVLMSVDRNGVVSTQSEDNEQYIVYTSCTICKARFEYYSPFLIETLKGMNAYIRSMAAKQLSNEQSSNNEDTIRTEQRIVSANVNSVVMDVIHSFQQEMQHIPSESDVTQDTHVDTYPVILQLFHELLKYMTPEELAKELATSVQYIRYTSFIIMGCATVLTGITLNMVFKKLNFFN